MTTELQAAAIEYVAAGLHVLALHQKKPNGRVHGDAWSWEDSFWSDAELTDADKAAIEQAFGLESTTGIAILIPPDFLVADVDSERAAELLLELGFDQHNPDTIVAQTKNGLHIWFLWPGAKANRWIGDGQEPEPTRTLLFKGLGGYVVAPPSLHFDDATGVVDGSYTWGTSLVSGGAIIMPDILPEKARERFGAEDQFAATAPPKQSMTSSRLVGKPGQSWWQWTRVWEYQTAGLEKAIEQAADGNQNNVIHWAALTAVEEGVPYEVAMERLLDAAVKGGHPRNRARDTIKGAYKRRRG